MENKQEKPTVSSPTCTALLCCPFCGSEMKYTKVGRDWHRVEPEKEHDYECILYDSQHDFPQDNITSLQAAYESWNTRAT